MPEGKVTRLPLRLQGSTLHCSCGGKLRIFVQRLNRRGLPRETIFKVVCLVCNQTFYLANRAAPQNLLYINPECPVGNPSPPSQVANDGAGEPASSANIHPPQALVESSTRPVHCSKRGIGTGSMRLTREVLGDSSQMKEECNHDIGK